MVSNSILPTYIIQNIFQVLFLSHTIENKIIAPIVLTKLKIEKLNIFKRDRKRDLQKRTQIV